MNESSLIPCARGTALLGMRGAAEELWGNDGLRDISRHLSEEARVATLDRILMPQAWVHEQHLIDFCRAVWEGPCALSEPALSQYLGRSAFYGWGRFQKIVLGFASPELIAARVPSLWRRDHTHGTLETELTRGGATLRLSNHPYIETEFAREMIGETFRQIMAMTRFPSRKVGLGVTMRHELEGKEGSLGAALLVHLAW